MALDQVLNRRRFIVTSCKPVGRKFEAAGAGDVLPDGLAHPGFRPESVGLEIVMTRFAGSASGFHGDLDAIEIA